ncbi:MAG: PAS domain-containing protein [Verrucomicrobia bacterium]|nr:PAS domain-containing protein [Cytophagales bacterium]
MTLIDTEDFKDLFNQSPELMVVIDTGFVIVAASDAFLKMTGMTREYVVGQNIFEVFPDNPNDMTAAGVSKIRASLNQVLKTKTAETLAVVRYDIPKPGPEGSGFEVKYWRPVHSPVLDSHQDVKYIIQRSEDVSEKEFLAAQLEGEKKTGEVSKANGDYIRNLFMQSPAPICVLRGPEHVYEMTNEKYRQLIGNKDIVGKPIRAVFPELEGQGFFELLDEVYATGKSFVGKEMPARFDIGGGEEKDIFLDFVYQASHDVDGKTDGILVHGVEVTEQVLARKKLEAQASMVKELLMTAPGFVCTLSGPDHVYEIVNEQYQKLFGERQIQGKPIMVALPELEGQGFDKLLDKVYNTGETYVGFDIPIMLAAEEGATPKLHYFNFSYQAMFDENKKTYSILVFGYEVTQQIRSKKIVEESEKYLRWMADLMPAKISHANAEGKVSYFNKHWLDFTGMDFEELRDFGYHNIMHPDELEEFQKRLHKAGETGTVLEMEMRFKNREGAYKWHLNRASPVKDENGNIQMWVGSTTEIHEQKTVDEKIRVSEERFRLLVMQAPVAICVVQGENHVIETINQAMADIWDRKIEAVLNKPVFDVLTEVQDQGYRELLDDVYRTGNRFLAQESAVSFIQNGKLENLIVKFIYEPLRDTDGKVTGVMALAHEITDQVLARRKIEISEKKFHPLTDAMPQKITNADAAGNVNFFNQQWQDDTGLTFDELKGSGWEKVMYPGDRELVKANWLQSVQTGAVFDMECRIKNREGKYRWNLSRAVPVRDENGVITMWVGSNTDIQEQKEQKAALEEAVRERTEELELANKELAFQNVEKEKRSEELTIANKELAFQNEEKEKRSVELTIANKELLAFNYVSSHDLQEPLRKIQTFTTIILEKENLSENGKYIFGRIQSAAASMQQLIQDLLSFSRTNNAERKFEKTDLSIIIEEIKAELNDTIQEKQATIEATNNCVANHIPFQFRQLMDNLISNALKFSKPGIAPHITIKSSIVQGSELNNKKFSPKKAYCHITVKDNGIGFEPHFSERIFEVFQKLHSKEAYAGTGIGLAIVKKIVENHNGIITATGELNEGATFDIYIPAS